MTSIEERMATIEAVVKRLEANQIQALLHIQNIENHQVEQNNFQARLDEVVRTHINGDDHMTIRDRLEAVFAWMRRVDDRHLRDDTERALVKRIYFMLMDSRVGLLIVAGGVGIAVGKL